MRKLTILGPLLFLIYINHSADGLSSNVKLCVRHFSIFGSSRSSHPEVFCENWQNSHENTCAKVSFLTDVMNCRSSRPQVFCEKGSFKNFAIFTAEHFC